VDGDVLQYGALGVLLAVLIGLFAIIKLFVQRMFDQMEHAQKFAEAEVERSHIQSAGNIQALLDLARDWIVAQTATAEALGNILVSLKELEYRLRKENGHE
jgi:hypothetical protein